MPFNPTNIETFWPRLKEPVCDGRLFDWVRECERQGNLQKLIIQNPIVIQEFRQTMNKLNKGSSIGQGGR